METPSAVAASADPLAPRALVEAGLDLVKRHPLPLLAPLALVGVLGAPAGPTYDFDVGPGRGGGPPPWELLPLLAFVGLVGLVVGALLLLLGILAWLVTVRAALDADAGREPDVRTALDGVKDRYWGSVLVLLLWGLAVAGGFLLLVVPGVVLVTGWFPVAAVLVAEGPGGADSLRRAWRLTDGHRWPLFLVLLLWLVAQVAASAVLGWIPLVGAVLSGAAAGAVNGWLAAVAAVYYRRRADAAAPPAAP